MRRSPFGSVLLAGLSALALAMGSCGSSQRQVCGRTPEPVTATPATTASPAASPRGATPAAARGARVTIDGNVARESIPARFKWDLRPLFASDAAFAAGLQQAATLRTRLATYRGTLRQPARLRACLALYFETRLLTNKLTLYANNRGDTAQQDPKLQSNADRALDAMNALIGTAGFIRKELLALDDRALRRAYRAAPQLIEYRPYIDEVRRRRTRALGDEAERVLALAGDNLWAEIDLNELPSDHEKTFGSLLGDIPLPKIKDATGAQVQLTLSNYANLRRSPDRRVRRDTVEALFGTLSQYRHALASTLSGQVRFNVMLARARGFATARQAYLDKDNIDPAVYDNLLSAVHANLAPLHRYIRMRRQIMGLAELHIYDLYTPMVPAPPMRFSYEDAVRLLPTALAPLGPAYVKRLRTGLDVDNGWLDLYPHRDKRSGAFCSAVFGTHPFVKMNYYGGFEDLSTLAHEYGHAMHSDLAMTHQPYVTAGYSSFLAEIASTTNEKLLLDDLLSRAMTDDERLSLLNAQVDRIRGTIYRQALFAEFEHAAHTAAERGQPLTADRLNATYKKLIQTYYGPDLTLGPNDDIEWAYIPHFYYKYYVFSYATGLSAGIAIAARVRGLGAPARDAYLGMLKAGASKPPLELLRGAGVDLAKPDAIAAAAKVMDETLGRMEEILARRAAGRSPSAAGPR